MVTANSPEEALRQLTVQRIALRAATPDPVATEQRFRAKNGLIIALLAAGVMLTVVGFIVSIAELVPAGWPTVFTLVGVSVCAVTGIWTSTMSRNLKRIQRDTVILDAYDTLIDRYKRGEPVTDGELTQFRLGVARLLEEEPDREARRLIILSIVVWIALSSVIVAFWVGGI